MAIRIECINKYPGRDPHRHITHIGGKHANGSRWKLTEEEAVHRVRSGKWDFYVEAGGRTARVIVVRSAAGNDYLKTQMDGYRPDNLLALPECP